MVSAGERTGTILPAIAQRYGLPRDTAIVAGTTDGCAAFLASGASDPGDGVTSLGTTLTLKLLSDRPVFAPNYGIYSHRIGDQWLAGGASNSGGAALAVHFDRDAIVRLSPLIDPDHPTGLDYYPLPKPGERFPINDPALPSNVAPRPDDERLFFQGLLEGIAGIEALGYRRLAELGASSLTTLRTVGGGAANEAWTRIRERRLKVKTGRRSASMRRSALRGSPGAGSGMIPIDGLVRIAADYDGMLIDQFGVLHDGAKLYPGSLDVLTHLRALQIPVAVMTNSGKRAAANVRRLMQMGIPRDFFVDAVSSGEVAYDLLRSSNFKRAFIIGKEGEDYGFDHFDLVTQPQDAEVILILGSNAPLTSLEDYARLLKGVTLPAICCNPDKLMLTLIRPAAGAGRYCRSL